MGEREMIGKSESPSTYIMKIGEFTRSLMNLPKFMFDHGFDLRKIVYEALPIQDTHLTEKEQLQLTLARNDFIDEKISKEEFSNEYHKLVGKPLGIHKIWSLEKNSPSQYESFEEVNFKAEKRRYCCFIGDRHHFDPKNESLLKTTQVNPGAEPSTLYFLQ